MFGISLFGHLIYPTDRDGSEVESYEFAKPQKKLPPPELRPLAVPFYLHDRCFSLAVAFKFGGIGKTVYSCVCGLQHHIELNYANDQMIIRFSIHRFRPRDNVRLSCYAYCRYWIPERATELSRYCAQIGDQQKQMKAYLEQEFRDIDILISDLWPIVASYFYDCTQYIFQDRATISHYLVHNASSG